MLISDIHRGQPADVSGGLYIGDAILSVNGISLRNAKHREAVMILSQQVSVCLCMLEGVKCLFVANRQ